MIEKKDFLEAYNSFSGYKKLSEMIANDFFEHQDFEVAKKQVDIERANKDKYARDSENEKLRKEVNDLRSQLFELTRKKDAESEEE